MITVILSVVGITALIAISFGLTYFDEVRGKKWNDRINHIRNAGSRMNHTLKNPAHSRQRNFSPGKTFAK